MDAPPPGLQMTGPAVLNFEMPSVDPSYFVNTGGDFHWLTYEQRATPAAWAERLQYRYCVRRWSRSSSVVVCACRYLAIFGQVRSRPFLLA